MEWSEVKDGVEILAHPEGVWTLAYEYVKGPALIKIETTDEKWAYAPGKTVNANGDLNALLLPKETIFPSAPTGAMIGKVGGSTAGTDDGRLFVVGKVCLLQIDQNTNGPIYLTINDQLSGMQSNAGSIKVKISIQPVALPNPPNVPSLLSAPAPVSSGPIPSGSAPGLPIPTGVVSGK